MFEVVDELGDLLGVGGGAGAEGEVGGVGGAGVEERVTRAAGGLYGSVDPL